MAKPPDESPPWYWRSVLRALIRQGEEQERRIRKLEGKGDGESLRLSVQTTALVRRLVEERTPLASAITPRGPRPSGDEDLEPHDWKPQA